MPSRAGTHTGRCRHLSKLSVSQMKGPRCVHVDISGRFVESTSGLGRRVEMCRHQASGIAKNVERLSTFARRFAACLRSYVRRPPGGMRSA